MTTPISIGIIKRCNQKFLLGCNVGIGCFLRAAKERKHVSALLPTRFAQGLILTQFYFDERIVVGIISHVKVIKIRIMVRGLVGIFLKVVMGIEAIQQQWIGHHQVRPSSCGWYFTPKHKETHSERFTTG